MKTPSIDILIDRITASFTDEGKELPYFPVKEEVPSLKGNIVFLGNCIDDLLHRSIFLPGKNYKIWTLSSAHAKLVATFLNCEERLVGVIPRDKIFPYSNVVLPLNAEEKIHLIYSGRVVSGKNVPSIINLASALRRDKQWDCSVHLFHPQVDEKIIRVVQQRAQEFSIDLVDHGDMGVNWYQKLPTNSVLVNLSTFASEDFNVSVAQAQMEGLPLILSEWGAFLDVKAPYLISISPLQIWEWESGQDGFTTDADFSMRSCLGNSPGRDPNFFSGEELIQRQERGRSAYSLNGRDRIDKIKMLHLSTLMKRPTRGGS